MTGINGKLPSMNTAVRFNIWPINTSMILITLLPQYSVLKPVWGKTKYLSEYVVDLVLSEHSPLLYCNHKQEANVGDRPSLSKPLSPVSANTSHGKHSQHVTNRDLSFIMMNTYFKK